MPEDRPQALGGLTLAYPGAGKWEPMGSTLETQGAWESHHVCENNLLHVQDCPC